MTPGSIVIVDWRDALPKSKEPNKKRPGIIIGSTSVFSERLPFRLVVPLTADERLVIEDASTSIQPSNENGCVKTSYALSWAVQCVSSTRLDATRSRVTDEQLAEIRAQVAWCISGS